MKTKIMSVLVILTLMLTGCQTPPNKQMGGAVLGGIAGGALGSQVGKGRGQVVATVVGTLLGAALGGAVGASMDETDNLKTQQALESTRDNQTVAWRNPNTSSEYQVTPTRTYESAGTFCRDFSTVAVIEGKRETIYGTACRQPDGTWQYTK